MTPEFSAARTAAAALAVTVALLLQTTVLPHIGRHLFGHGIVPNLVLLVVVASGLVRGSHFAMVLGFGAGVLLDLAPPADHVAGRWALALLVAGYVAGRVRQSMGDGNARPTLLTALATVGACSFLGSSVFALSGLVLQDPPLQVPDLLQVVLVGVVWDLVLTPFVVPLVMRMFVRLDAERSPA